MQRFIRRDNNECFIGTMQYMYFKAYKMHISEHRLKKLFNYTYKGVSVGSIVVNAHLVGFDAKAYEVETKVNVEGKYIVARKDGEYIHYYGCDNNMFFDPANGTEKEGELKVGDIVIVLNEKPNFKPIDDIVHIKSKGMWLPTIVLIGFLGSLLSIYGSYFMNDLHTFIGLGQNTNHVLYKYLIIGAIGILLLVCQRLLLQKLLAMVNKKMFKRYSHTLLNTSISLTRYFSLAHIKRVASDIGLYVEFEVARKVELLNSIVLFICSLILIANESIELLCLSTSMAFFFGFFKVLYKRKHKLNFERLREKSLSLDDTVNHLHQNIKRAVGNDKKQYEMLLENDIDALIKCNLESSKTTIFQDMILQTIVTIFSIVVPVIIFVYLKGESIDIGKGLFLILICGFLFNNLVNILSFAINFEQNDVYKYKVSDFLIVDKRIKENFTYDGDACFKSFEYKSGQVQLVGDNGSGKSTMLNLLAGLETNFDDSIYYLSSESLPIKEGNKFVGRNNMSQGERQIVNAMILMEASAKLVILDEAFNSIKKDLRLKIYLDILKKFKNVIIVDHDVDLNINTIIV